MDTVGTFGRTVADAVHGLSAIAGTDKKDGRNRSPSRAIQVDYSKYLATRSILEGAKFGLPGKKCWDLVTEDNKTIALKIFGAIRAAGGEIIPTEFPCAEDHIPPDGGWDWLVPWFKT